MSSEHTKVSHTDLIMIIKNVISQEDKTVRMIFQKNTGEKFLYPPLDKMLYMNVGKVIDVLDYVVQAGFMGKRVVETLRFCPVCFSYEIIPTEHCPNCSSTNISRGRVIEHFSCGYRNLETVFLLNTGLECPRCHKQLLIEGKDFSRGKLMYKCHACGNLFESPMIDYHCQRCGEYFPVDELGETIVYHYEVINDKLEYVSLTLKTLESIEANLRENGYTTKFCTQVTGASGISYDIDLYAANVSKNDSLLVVTYLIEDTIAVDEILRLQALGYDLGAKKIAILTFSKLDQKAEYLANYYGMKRIVPEKTGEVTKEIMVELI